MRRTARIVRAVASATALLAWAGAAGADGPIVGWGEEHGGTTMPVSVNGIAGAASAVAVGRYHLCALRAGTGAVVCWGGDSDGQATPPLSVNGILGTASAIAAGDMHSCAIQASSGAVVCWGRDFFGEATPPLSVNGVAGTASAVATGFGHTCAIQVGSDAVVCWGNDDYGRTAPPASVNGTSGTASAIATGELHSCAIQAGTGEVVCWGNILYGQTTPPASVNGTSGTASAVAAGARHSCAIQTGTGAVVCWGDDSFGQATPPASVNGTMGKARAIAMGRDHSCAIQAGTDAVVCWGSDAESQATPPASVNGISGTAAAIAAGGDQTLAIRIAPLERGELLVSDFYGGRVVRVNRYGTAYTFSPQPGHTDHLVNPAGIVVEPDGDAYVADVATDRLIRIDRRSGAQSVVREPDLDPFGEPPPTSIGNRPWGIDLFEDILGLRHLFVSAEDSLHAADEGLFVDGFQGSLRDATLPTSPFGLAVRSDGPVLDSVWIAAGADGLWSWDASEDTASQVLASAAGEWYLDVDFQQGVLGLPVFTRVEEEGLGGCVAGTGGVFSAFMGVHALSQGGLLRCPMSLAFVPERGAIYVADAAGLVAGGEGRVVMLRQGDPDWEQTLLVDSTELDIQAPLGIAYVPEPDATALGVAVLTALGVAMRRGLVSSPG